MKEKSVEEKVLLAQLIEKVDTMIEEDAGLLFSQQKEGDTSFTSFEEMK